jgi:WD40 repeat protein
VAADASPDGTRLVSFSEDGITRLWDTATGREKLWGTRTRLWDATTGRERPWVEHMAHWTAAFSPDGTRLATGSTDHVVRLWDPASGSETTLMPHDNEVTMVLFSPDGPGWPPPTPITSSDCGTQPAASRFPACHTTTQ